MLASTHWQLAHDAAASYARVLVPPILGPAAQSLVHGAELRPGHRVLDVGCGTGVATTSAAELTGCAIGVDNNPGMLAEMRRVLRPGARLHLSLWCESRRCPYFHALIVSVARHMGEATAQGLRSRISIPTRSIGCPSRSGSPLARLEQRVPGHARLARGTRQTLLCASPAP